MAIVIVIVTGEVGLSNFFGCCRPQAISMASVKCSHGVLMWRGDPHWIYAQFLQSLRPLSLDPVPPHMLRHLAASLLIAAGVDIAIVSKRLGHSKSTLRWTPTDT